MKARLRAGVVATALLAGSAVAGPAAAAKVAWRGWSDDLFVQARKEKKLVILDLEAIWCHWCHVMDEKTYSQDSVAQVLGKRYVAVKVDQDSRPDLSRKYEDYGWPATIIFDSQGRELAKRSGYIRAEEMASLLERLARKPVPEPEAKPEGPVVAAESPFLPAPLKARLRERHLEQYDSKNGGWGEVHKFLFGEPEELALRDSWQGDAQATSMAKGALDAALALIDPAWGGAYQYSVDGWKDPHFEKIADKQADNLELYSSAFALYGDARYGAAAESVRKFLHDFLRSPEGAFYTSMDADLVKGVHSDGFFKLSGSDRRKQGVPAVDQHVYARENGRMIHALAAHYAATGSTSSRDEAMQAARWIAAHRAVPGGGYQHGEASSGLFLGDTLEMAYASLKLYEVTAQREWLARASEGAAFIRAKFAAGRGKRAAGFATSIRGPVPGQPAPLTRDENVRAARFFNQLHEYTGLQADRDAAERAMRYVVAPAVAEDYPTAGPLLADLELGEAPVHVTIVGSKQDPEAAALFAQALRYPAGFRRIEWWDRAEGPLPRGDVKYPELKKAAAFGCSGGRCSAPVQEASQLRAKIDRLYGKAK